MQLQVASAWDNCIPLTIQQNSFEEENFHKFRGFVAICESFLHEIEGVASLAVTSLSNLQKFSPRKSYFVKVFTLESFALYST